MKPSVGRVVHYVARGSADGKFKPVCRAATVAEVYDNDSMIVGLAVLNPTGVFFDQMVEFADQHDQIEPVGGTWHWPERVD